MRNGDAKICPVCGTLNPPSAEVCECGYTFRDGPVLSEDELRQRARKRKLRSAIASFFVGLVIIALMVLTAVYGASLGIKIILFWIALVVVSALAVFVISKIIRSRDREPRQKKNKGE